MTTIEAPPDVTREILTAPAHEANVFTAWSDGFAAGLIDLRSLTHRAYERGHKDAAFQNRVTWLVLCGACLIAGILIGILGFAA